MPATIEQLPASPQAILEDRSFFVPQEPEAPDQVIKFWDSILRHSNGEAGLPHSIDSQLAHNAGLTAMDLGIPVDVALSFDSVQWYIHQKAEMFRDNPTSTRSSDRSAVAGLWGGVILRREFTTWRSDAEAISTVFVVPEALDGILDNLHVSRGYLPVEIVYIGNVGKNFAERAQSGTRTTLYGNATSFVAAYSGRNISSTDLPVVRVHGNVGDHAAHCAESLLLHVTGSAGDDLAVHAGSAPDKHNKLMIRVEGSAGERVANNAHGRLAISCGSIESIGDVTNVVAKSTIEVGANPPGHGNEIVFSR